jgi:hypothetical protein
VKPTIRATALLTLLLTIGLIALTVALTGQARGVAGTLATDGTPTGNGFTWGDHGPILTLSGATNGDS